MALQPDTSPAGQQTCFPPVLLQVPAPLRTLMWDGAAAAVTAKSMETIAAADFILRTLVAPRMGW